MKVFISWSGARSKAVAELLDEWIQCVIQAVEPWMSAKDIDRGALWFTSINDELKEVTAGIVCLTQENKDRPWILFEAGALARGISTQRVITFLVDLQPTDIEDPLAQFNHTLPDEAGLHSLAVTINSRLGDRRLSERTLQNSFGTYWPQFRDKFARLMVEHPVVATSPPRTGVDKMDEILEHVRGIDRRLRSVESRPQSSPRYIRNEDNKSGSTDMVIIRGMVTSMTAAGLSYDDITRDLVHRGYSNERVGKAILDHIFDPLIAAAPDGPSGESSDS